MSSIYTLVAPLLCASEEYKKSKEQGKIVCAFVVLPLHCGNGIGWGGLSCGSNRSTVGPCLWLYGSEGA